MQNNKLKYFTKSILVFLLFFATLQLSGCSPFHRTSGYGRDCAPNFHIDPNKVSDAVPNDEPRSKYGNPSSYVVKGHRYYVMKSAEGYDEKGIASWYGMKFYKFKTSSGEYYNVAAMTAASRVLPLPTYCLVTNLQNGKHVVVKVNDRGPFVANRIMDLSYVAALKLGVTAHGTALVEVKAIDPRHPCSVTQAPVCTAASSTPCIPRLYLQMGAFSVPSNAQVLADQVKRCVTYPVTIKESDLNGRTIYKVQIGPIRSVDDSDAIYAKLRAAGLGKPIAVVN